MRHQKKRSRLNRNRSHRMAMYMNMANSLIVHQRIETTKAKAKGLQCYIEPLITIAKNSPESVAARRRIFSKLCNKDIIKLLFNEIAPLFKDIKGGYTRIIPAGIRKGDAADMVIMELTKRTKTDAELLKIIELAPKEIKKKKKSDKAGEEDEAQTEEEKEIKKPKVPKKKTDHKDKQPKQKGFLKRFRRQAGDK